MIRLYIADTIDFNNNGVGILRDTISCEVIEALNGELVLNMSYPIKSKYIESIVNENIIKCDAGFQEEQLFRIKNVKSNIDTISIYAEHITYDLNDNLLEDTFPQELTGASAIDWILLHTAFKHNFIGASDILSINSARYVRKNPIQAIVGDLDNSFVKLWGGELVRDNFHLQMLQRRGADKGYTIKHRKNLLGLDFIIDNSNIVTRIMPQGYNGLFLPEKYVDSPIINSYANPKIKVIEYENVKVKEKEDDEEGFDTTEEAYEELRRLANLEFTDNNIDKPLVNLKVDFIDLYKTTEYKDYLFLQDVLMGDTVTIILDYTKVTVRVIKTTYDGLLKRYTKLELGEFTSNFIADSDKEVTKTVKREVGDIETTILEQAQATSTQLLTNALEGNITKTRAELFILDALTLEAANKIWRWNINGLGYSSTGVNGPYGLAMTMDGAIVASFIKTGNMLADRIAGGTLKLGGNNNYSGVFSLLDELAQEIIRMDYQGITLKNGAKLIGGNGVLSNFQFVSNNNDWLGYETILDQQKNAKTQISIEAFIPENFVIQSAYVTLKHAPIYWHGTRITGENTSENLDIWGYSRNIRLYKVINLNYIRNAYLMSEYYDDNISDVVEVESAFGTSGFTANIPDANNHNLQTIKSIDVKNYLVTGNNMLVLQTANDPPVFANDFVEENATKQTGQGEAILNVIGYMS